VINPQDKFRAAVEQAVELIHISPERIVTFGIKPTYPAEVFGYIERGAPIPMSDSTAAAYDVARFREKPDSATAEKYLRSGSFYWNSGIFVWSAATILEALGEHQPAMVQHLTTVVDAWETAKRDEVFQREFEAIDGISIDFAVMEHASEIAVIEAPFEWDDLGGWQSLMRLAGTDQNDNTVVGRHIGVATSGSIVRTTQEHLVVTLGVENLIVVHTPNATLVADKHHEESIRQIVSELENRGWTEFL
jgi:mannose-1-phosphate guanylyltransferase